VDWLFYGVESYTILWLDSLCFQLVIIMPIILIILATVPNLWSNEKCQSCETPPVLNRKVLFILWDFQPILKWLKTELNIDVFKFNLGKVHILEMWGATWKSQIWAKFTPPQYAKTETGLNVTMMKLSLSLQNYPFYLPSDPALRKWVWTLS